MEHLFPPTFNFLLFTGLLFYFLRKPVRAYVAGRHTTIRDTIHSVRAQLRASQAKFEEYGSKLKAMDVEVQALKSQARNDAQESKTRIIKNAEQLAKTLVSDSKAAAEGQFSTLRAQLRQELGARIVARAESLLQSKLTGDDRARIRREFSNLVGGARP